MLMRIGIAIVLLGIGYFFGSWHAGRSAEIAHRIGLGAQLVRQDKVLSLIEMGSSADAQRVQLEYLKLSMIEASGYGGDWPELVNSVLLRRAPSVGNLK